MMGALALEHDHLARLRRLASAAIANVSRGLTEMFSATVAVTALRVETVPLAAVPALLGDAELEVAAVYLVAEGDIPGHLLLVLALPSAYTLCDILLEQPAGATVDLGDLERSALGEVGNIVGSFFLNSIADDAGMRLTITPPGVVCDMAGAVINLALIEVAMSADEAVVIDANFEHAGERVPAWFLAFPDPDHLRRALDREVAA